MNIQPLVKSQINSFILEVNCSPNETEISYSHTIYENNAQFQHIFTTLDAEMLIGGNLTYNLSFPFSTLDSDTHMETLELFSLVMGYFLSNKKSIKELEFDSFYRIESTSEKSISIERLLFDYSIDNEQFHVKDIGLILAYDDYKTVH